jgi:hypothetical protein
MDAAENPVCRSDGRNCVLGHSPVAERVVPVGTGRIRHPVQARPRRGGGDTGPPLVDPRESHSSVTPHAVLRRGRKVRIRGCLQIGDSRAPIT